MRVIDTHQGQSRWFLQIYNMYDKNCICFFYIYVKRWIKEIVIGSITIQLTTTQFKNFELNLWLSVPTTIFSTIIWRVSFYVSLFCSSVVTHNDDADPVLQEIMMHFYGYSVFLPGCSFSTRITFRQWGCPKNRSARDEDKLFLFLFHKLPGLRVLENIFFDAFGCCLQTDLCPLMDDRIGQWTRMQRVQPNRHHPEWKKTPLKLRASKNLCIFIDMQSAVAGRRWRREKRRTCVRVSVSAAWPARVEAMAMAMVVLLDARRILRAVATVRRSTCLAYCRIA